MNGDGEIPYVVNFRYWVGGKLLQLQSNERTLGSAMARISNASAAARANGNEWLGEIFPRLGSVIIQGSPAGLQHHREDLF